MSRSPGIFLGTYDVLVKGKGAEVKTQAHFFYNHQGINPIWIEAPPAAQKWPAGTAVEVVAPGVLTAFPASVGGICLTMHGGVASACLPISPSMSPLDSVPADNLQTVSFAVLDCPFAQSVRRTPEIVLRCAQFDATLTDPSDSHRQLAAALGSTPHALNQTCTLRERSGQSFSSGTAVPALNTLHDVLSFAAGRWIGFALVEGRDESNRRVWFRLGTTRINEPSYSPCWFDESHPEWLSGLCDGLLAVQSDEQATDVMQRALYWYTRSNTRGGGIDGALILTQCALELLSWFVIVRRCRALSECGYGQLADASERMRLMLSLLGIPLELPRSLPRLHALKKEWADVPEAVVRARNYLVHPTQSRSGKLTQKKQFPWEELWLAGQWILELVILRLLGYGGEYQNRTRIREFNRVETVPWAR